MAKGSWVTENIGVLILVLAVVFVTTFGVNRAAYASQQQLAAITPAMIKTQISGCYAESQFLKGIESDSDGDGLVDNCDPCLGGDNLGQGLVDDDNDGFIDACDRSPKPDKDAITSCCLTKPTGEFEEMQKACPQLIFYEPKFICKAK
jgi:hypothetical protein